MSLGLLGVFGFTGETIKNELKNNSNIHHTCERNTCRDREIDRASGLG